MNYGKEEKRFEEVQLADWGGTVEIGSAFAREGAVVGTDLFRAPEIFLEMSVL